MPEHDLDAVVEFTNRVLGASGLDLKANADQTGDGLKVQVLRADSRRVHTLVVVRLVAAPQLPLEV